MIDPQAEEEVLVFEPCFPQYYDHIQMAGATFKPVPLEFKENKWVFDPESFKRALSDKTKVVILNNAQNPTGKLFTVDELELISKILDEYPKAIVISDDVYEYLVFDNK